MEPAGAGAREACGAWGLKGTNRLQGAQGSRPAVATSRQRPAPLLAQARGCHLPGDPCTAAESHEEGPTAWAPARRVPWLVLGEGPLIFAVVPSGPFGSLLPGRDGGRPPPGRWAAPGANFTFPPSSFFFLPSLFLTLSSPFLPPSFPRDRTEQINKRMDRWTDDRRGDQNAGEQNVGFPQDAGGALFVFRNRSFPKAFRGIHDSVEQPTGGPGVRRARPACPGTGQCSAGAGARASAGPPRRLAPHSWPPPCQASRGRDRCSQVGLGTRTGAGEGGSWGGRDRENCELGSQGAWGAGGSVDKRTLGAAACTCRVCGCARVSVQAPAGRGSTLTPSWEPPPPTGVREP